MTAVKDSVLYKTLKKAVREEDHAELLRMLEMVPDRALLPSWCWDGFGGGRLSDAFDWGKSPQGHKYWDSLSDSLYEAGHDCY